MHCTQAKGETFLPQLSAAAPTGRSVLELLLTADVRRLHTACAECLEGAVETLQLAQHNEKAGRLLQAARLHSAHSITLQTHSAGHDVVGAAARRAVECARHAEPASEQTERMEIRALLTLLGTWTLDNVEMTAAFERCAHARLPRRMPARLAVSPPLSRSAAGHSACAWLLSICRPFCEISGPKCDGLPRSRLEVLRQGSAGDEIDAFGFAVAMFSKELAEFWKFGFMEVHLPLHVSYNIL